MAEQPRPCPHCQGTDLKISPREWYSPSGMVLACLNEACMTRIWGHDEADVVARWNRRIPGPATQAMLADAQKTLDELRERVPKFNLSENSNPWLLMLQAFLDEWKPR